MNALKSTKGIAVAAIAALLVIAVGGWFLVHESGGSAKTGSSQTPKKTASATPSPSASSPSSSGTASASGSTPSPTSSAGSASPIPTHPTLSGPTIATASPIGLQERARLTNGGAAKVTTIESVTSKAELPGELSRPAIRVTVTLTSGARSIALSNVVVNAYYGRALTPAVPVGQPGGKPFSGTLRAHSSAKGVYIFNIPKSARGDVRIEVAYAASSPTAIFEGAVS